MTLDNQSLIEKRPHLKEPLQLYANWQLFQLEVAELLPKVRSAGPAEEARAYPKAIAGKVYSLFADIFQLPSEELAPLRQAMERGDIDFLRLPLDEMPLVPSLSCTEDELSKILFLLARPYFQALRESYPLDGTQWEDGRCPLCSARPALATIVEGPKRHLHCSFCSTSGTFRFIGCPNCQATDAALLTTIESEDEPGFRVVTCDGCKTYVKVMESSILQEMTIDQADLASLPLDIVAQEKGYVRLSPNPIALKTMV